MTLFQGSGETFRWPRALAFSLLAHLVVAGIPAQLLLAERGDVSETRRPGAEIEVRLVPWGGEVHGPRLAESRPRAPLPSLEPSVEGTVTPPAVPPNPAVPVEAVGPPHDAPLPSGTEPGLGSGLAGPAAGPEGAGGADSEHSAGAYQPPRLLAGALPIDPGEMQELEVPPEIPVRIRVGPDGRVLEIVPLVDRLSPPVLRAVQRSAEAMRFAPARLHGEPVESWFSMTFVHRR